MVRKVTRFLTKSAANQIKRQAKLNVSLMLHERSNVVLLRLCVHWVDKNDLLKISKHFGKTSVLDYFYFI